MRVLDLDMDYFMDSIAAYIPDSADDRLSEEEYGSSVWDEQRVRDFIENHLGLSRDRRIKGRIVKGHNEALFWWQELIQNEELTVPFEVVHIDSHADLGLGYSSWKYILESLLQYPVKERPLHSIYVDCFGKMKGAQIGDYLLFAIAYRWISRLTYCANPKGDKNDYLWEILKNFEEELIWDKTVQNVIQLVCNTDMSIPDYDDSQDRKKEYINKGIKEPEVSFLVIPTIEEVMFNGDFDYVVMAQSPNYTPKSADYIMEILSEYIVEC